MPSYSNETDCFVDVVVGGVFIPPSNVTRMILSMDLETKLPVMRLTFMSGSVMQRNAPIQDGTVVRVSYGMNENLARSASFVVRSCVYVQNPEQATTYIYTISAVLDVDDHKAETFVHEKKTSSQVARDVAGKHGFEFRGELEGDDEMTWLQICQDDWSFLKDVERHAYAGDYDHVSIFPDLWGNITYTSFKKQISSAEKTVLVAEGCQDLLDEAMRGNCVPVSGCKFLAKSGIINSTGAYGSRASMHDDSVELSLVLRDMSTLTKNVSRKAEFADDLASNLDYGYQPTSVHPHYLYARAANEHVLFSMMTDLVETRVTMSALSESQAKTLLGLKPADCVWFQPMLQRGEKDAVNAGKHIVKKLDINYAPDEGLCFYFLIGRAGMNLSDEYQGVPVTSAAKGIEQPTGATAMGLEASAVPPGPLASVCDSASGKKEPPKKPEPHAVPATDNDIADFNAKREAARKAQMDALLGIG